jgi:hypothetical protein
MKDQVGPDVPINLLEVKIEFQVQERIFITVVEIEGIERATLIHQERTVFIPGCHHHDPVPVKQQGTNDLEPVIVQRPGIIRYKSDGTPSGFRFHVGTVKLINYHGRSTRTRCLHRGDHFTPEPAKAISDQKKLN